MSSVLTFVLSFCRVICSSLTQMSFDCVPKNRKTDSSIPYFIFLFFRCSTIWGSNFCFAIASAKLNFCLIQMTSLTSPSFYASLVALILIISVLLVVYSFLIPAFNSVSLYVRIIIMIFFYRMLMMSCCVKIAASHTSATPNVSASITYLTNLLDIVLDKEIMLPSSVLSVIGIMYLTFDHPLLLPPTDPSEGTKISNALIHVTLLTF